MASSPQHEPTMEEILASIRKIISEDATEQPQSAPSAVHASPAEPDVLELTDEIREEPAAAPVEPPTPVAATKAVPEVETAPAQPIADDVVFQTIEETSVNSSGTLHSSDGIFSDKTRKAVSDAFTSVEPEPASSPSPEPAAAVAPLGGLSVETVFDRAVRETFDPVLTKWLTDNADSLVERMKPLVSAWLDEHFPAMLEDAVRQELSRAKAQPRR